MKKWMRRILVVVLVALAGVAAFVTTSFFMLRAEPDWYHPPTWTPEQREAAAHRAEVKIGELQSRTGEAHAVELRAQNSRAGGAPTKRPPATSASAITVRFSDDELNAVFSKWSAINGWQASYERFLSDPMILLRDRRLILAGKLKEFDAVVSLHFEPRIDESGRLDLRLVRILGGKLPLPQAILDRYADRVTSSLRHRLGPWQRGAMIQPTGVANTDAVNAAMGLLILRTLRHEPTEPVVFLPGVEGRKIPLRISDLQIEGRELMMTVEPMTAAERAQLLQRLRGGVQPVVSAVSK